jgi:hypothetical protein
MFTPVVHYGSCPQRTFVHNIHTEFSRFAQIYGSTAVVVWEGLGAVGWSREQLMGWGGERDICLNTVEDVWGSGGITSTFVVSAVARGEQLASHFGRSPLNRSLCVHVAGRLLRLPSFVWWHTISVTNTSTSSRSLLLNFYVCRTPEEQG